MLKVGKSKEFWASFKNDPKKAWLVDFLKEEYEAYYIGETIPQLRYSLRMLHDKVGTRREFETPYFRRRHFLSASAPAGGLPAEKDPVFPGAACKLHLLRQAMAQWGSGDPVRSAAVLPDRAMRRQPLY